MSDLTVIDALTLEIVASINDIKGGHKDDVILTSRAFLVEYLNILANARKRLIQNASPSADASVTTTSSIEVVGSVGKWHSHHLQHTKECWEPDSGCDVGRNEKYVHVVKNSTPNNEYDEYWKEFRPAMIEAGFGDCRDSDPKLAAAFVGWKARRKIDAARIEAADALAKAIAKWKSVDGSWLSINDALFNYQKIRNSFPT